jgi:hypothetical protein
MRPVLLGQLEGFVIDRCWVEIRVAPMVEIHALRQKPARSVQWSSISTNAVDFHLVSWTWNALRCIWARSMDCSGPQSVENKTFNTSHPNLHLHPILPFELGPVWTVLKILTPMACTIFYSWPLRCMGIILQNLCKVYLRRDISDSVPPFRVLLCLRRRMAALRAEKGRELCGGP